MAMLWMLLSVALFVQVLGQSNTQVSNKQSGPKKPRAEAALTPATGCSTVRLSGTSDHDSVEGEYEYIETGCGLNRNVYYNSDAQYYLFYESTSPAGWLFSATKCSIVGAVKADSTSSIPESVTVSWDESYILSWVAKPFISVQCYNGAGMVQSSIVAFVFVLVAMVITRD